MADVFLIQENLINYDYIVPNETNSNNNQQDKWQDKIIKPVIIKKIFTWTEQYLKF
jgi:hypothetical protein